MGSRVPVLIALGILSASAVCQSDIVIESWPLTFLHQNLPSTATNAQGTGSSADNDTAAKVATALNNIFAHSGKGFHAEPVSRNVVLRGCRKDVQGAKRILAKFLDVPYPQVRLEFYVFSGSEGKSKAGEISSRLELISQGAALTRAFGVAYRIDLENFLSQVRLDSRLPYGEIGDVFQRFRIIDPLKRRSPGSFTRDAIAGLRNPHSSLVELLTLCSLAERAGFREALSKHMRSGLAMRGLHDTILGLPEIAKATEDSGRRADLALLEKLARDLFVRSGGYVEKGVRPLYEPFGLFGRFIEGSDARVESGTVIDFLEAYSSDRPISSTTVPYEYLSAMSSNTDSLLRSAVEALGKDFRSAIVEPLIDWISRDVKSPSGKHVVTLDGTTTLNVTSTQLASAKIEADSFLPYTPPLKASKEQLAAMLDLLPGTATSPAPGTAAARSLVELFAGLTPPPTTYTHLAPGLSLNVIPTVMPGSRTARVLIDYSFAVDAENKPSQDAKEGSPPIDIIRRQTARTDVAIDAFDLFPLNSMSVETGGPAERKWEIPLLSGLPYLGGWFRSPRTIKQTVHKGLTIVSATIVPRSLDVTRRYDDD